MGRRRGGLRRLLRDQSGVTITEVLATAAILAVVLGAIFSLVDTTAKIAPQDQERTHVIREAQAGLHRMTRELRQTYRLNGWGPNWIDVNVRFKNADYRVLYECHGAPYDSSNPTYDRCMRRAAPVGQTLPSTGDPVVSNLLNGEVSGGSTAVFNYGSGALPSFVKVRLEVPARGTRKDGADHNVVLDDGVFMRNLTAGD